MARRKESVKLSVECLEGRQLPAITYVTHFLAAGDIVINAKATGGSVYVDYSSFYKKDAFSKNQKMDCYVVRQLFSVNGRPEEERQYIPFKQITGKIIFNGSEEVDHFQFNAVAKKIINVKADGRGGNDILKGSHGRDTLSGGGGEDRLFGNGGNDLLLGGDNLDRLYGGTGSDTLKGEAGDDILDGYGSSPGSLDKDGVDELWGGIGEDQFRPDGYPNRDIMIDFDPLEDIPF